MIKCLFLVLITVPKGYQKDAKNFEVYYSFTWPIDKLVSGKNILNFHQNYEGIFFLKSKKWCENVSHMAQFLTYGIFRHLSSIISEPEVLTKKRPFQTLYF